MGWSIDCCKAALAALLLLLASWSARAQFALLESYQESAGLTNLTVISLAQDPQGAMWIATENGLFRFDGFRIRREDVPVEAGLAIYGLHADRRGRLWMAAEGGLFLRCRAGSAWTPVKSPDGAAILLDEGHRLDVDQHDIAYAMDRGQRLWMVPVSGNRCSDAVAQRLALPAFEPPVGTRAVSSGPVLASGNSFWFGCGEGLCEWRDRQLRTWGPAQGLPRRSWANLLSGRDGSVWARSHDRLARLAAGASAFEDYDAPADNRWPASVALAEDQEGAILTSTERGLARWDGNSWQCWGEQDGMPDTAVRTLLFDAEGTLWLGAAGRGLHRWVGYRRTEHWTTSYGLPSPAVFAFARDGGGRLWVSTARGTAWFDPKQQRFRVPHVPAGASAGGVLSMATDSKGAIWWVEGGRLLTVPQGTSAAEVVLEDASLITVLQDGSSIYLVSRKWTAQFSGSRTHPIGPMLPAGPPAMRIVNMDGEQWFVVAGRIVRPRGASWEPLLDAQGTPVQALDIATTASPRRLWAVSADGIVAYQVEGALARKVAHYEFSRFGGPSPMFLRSSADGRVWFGTDLGTFVLEGGRWHHLDRSNGLLWNDVDDRAFMADADGSVWIGTSAGLTHVRASPALHPPPARLWIQELRFGTRAFTQPPTEPLAWSERRLQVSLGTGSLGRGPELRIEYRMGADTPWHSIDGSVLQIESLEAGEHLLELRAAGRLPVDEAGPVMRLAFEVRPPWWRSKPAWAGYALALAALWWSSAWLLGRRADIQRRALEHAIAERTAELEASRGDLRRLGEHNARLLEEERTRVSRELHDELGQQLAALRMEVSVLRVRSAGSQPPRPEQLDALLQRVDGAVGSMRGLVSQLRPPALDGGLKAAIEWLAAEFGRLSGAEIHLDIDPAAVRGLSPDSATMVFRIAQESLNNVRRHAHARHVELCLHLESNGWVLTVADDGIGFEPANEHAGYGLLGMEERARLLGGTLNIRSAPGKGATIEVRVGLM